MDDSELACAKINRGAGYGREEVFAASVRGFHRELVEVILKHQPIGDCIYILILNEHTQMSWVTFEHPRS